MGTLFSLRHLLVFVSSATLVLFFQNCAGSGFDSFEEISSLSADDIDSDYDSEVLPPDEGTSVVEQKPCLAEAGVLRTYAAMEDFDFPPLRLLKDGETLIIKFCQARHVPIKLDSDGNSVFATRGNFTSVENTGTAGGVSIRTLTLSKIKGDRGLTLPVTCKKFSMTTTLSYQIGGSSLSKCVLEPGQTYYLNLFHDDPVTGKSFCPSPVGCGISFYHYRNP